SPGSVSPLCPTCAPAKARLRVPRFRSARAPIISAEGVVSRNDQRRQALFRVRGSPASPLWHSRNKRKVREETPRSVSRRAGGTAHAPPKPSKLAAAITTPMANAAITNAAGRMFYNDAEPRFHEVGSAGRVAGHRVRTARGRSNNLVGAELSYVLSALGPAR